MAPVTSIVMSKMAAEGCSTTLLGGSEAPRWLTVLVWVVKTPGYSASAVMNPIRIAAPASESSTPAILASRDGRCAGLDPGTTTPARNTSSGSRGSVLVRAAMVPPCLIRPTLSLPRLPGASQGRTAGAPRDGRLLRCPRHGILKRLAAGSRRTRRWRGAAVKQLLANQGGCRWTGRLGVPQTGPATSAGQDARVVHQLDSPDDQDRGHENGQEHLGRGRLGQREGNDPQHEGDPGQGGLDPADPVEQVVVPHHQIGNDAQDQPGGRHPP